MMKCIQTRNQKAGRGEKGKPADLCYADSKCNSKNDCFVSQDGEDGLETLLLFVLHEEKNLHFPSAGTDWVAPSMIYLEKGKQFSKGSPENVVRQAKLKPGWNQMSNLISDISLRYILLGWELLWVW